MNRKKLGLMLGAAAIAVCNALIAHSLLSGQATPSAQALEMARHGPRVLVARRDLPVGTIITPDALNFIDWPKQLVNPDDQTSAAYFLDSTTSAAKLAGTVVRTEIAAGQPITHGALVAPGDRGFLAAALGPGMRAVTIAVTERSGVGGFVFPGDRVDLMLTQTMHDEEGGGAMNGGQPFAVTETILRDLRVLATDQSVGADLVGGHVAAHASHSVTLEVSPRNAEKIEVAQSIGALSLTLRALTDTAAGANPDGAIASGSLSIPANASRQDEERLIAQNAANADSASGGDSFVTGGDVSRFLRRSLPRLVAGPLTDGGRAPGMSSPMHSASAAMGSAAAPAPPPWRDGAVVTVSRGKDTTPVSVGGQ